MKIVVFSGGSGTRMWPLSRKELPKQFQNLVGEKSMFQQMVDNVLLGFDPKDTFVLTGENYIDLVRNQVPQLPKDNIIGEPEMRDTLAAVGFACAYINKKFPDETMAAIWGADHVIKDTKTFVKALKAAEKLTNERNVITKVDVRPSFPSIHLGYIQIGKKIGEIDDFDFFEFVKHIEKPDFAKAEKFLESGNYLWNTGYFVWKTDKMMELFKKYTPDVASFLIKIQESIGTKFEKEEIAKNYSLIPKKAIDHALFEKLQSEDQLEISATLGWTDVGAWNVLKDELADDESGNVVRADHIDIDSSDCLVYEVNENKIVATVGLKGMIIVDTPDALLICPKDRAADVKKIVEKLKEKNKQQFL